jgi:hypothetical protein
MGLGGRVSRPRSALAIVLAVAGAAATPGAPARAALLVYEPFDYGAGTILENVPATGLNLTGDYAAPGIITGFELRARAPGLDYGSLSGAPSATGQRLTQQSGTTAGIAVVGVDEDVVVGPGETIYWSALFTLSDAANGNHLAHLTLRDDTNGDTITFGEPAVGSRALRIETFTQATGQLVAAGPDGAFVSGQTLFLVGRYLNAAAPGADRLDLLAYDTADADALPPVFDPGDPGVDLAIALSNLDVDFARISSLTFTIRGNDNNYIDELRIGSNYGAVVPEPSTGALLLVGVLGLAARAHRAGAPRYSGSSRSFQSAKSAG